MEVQFLRTGNVTKPSGFLLTNWQKTKLTTSWWDNATETHCKMLERNVTPRLGQSTTSSSQRSRCGYPLERLPKPWKKFNAWKLKQNDTKQMFQISLPNRFEVLQSKEAETVKQRWSTFKEAVAGACKKVLGQAKFRKKLWISGESWKKVEKRRLVKQEMNQADSPSGTVSIWQTFCSLKKSQKKIRADKRMYFKTFADEAEDAARKGDLKTLYATTRILSGRHFNSNRPVRNKERKLHTTEEDQLARGKKYF